MESGTKLRESLALAYWAEVVGEQAAAASQAETIRDGILFVRTKSSVWSHELTFLKAHILAELNRRIGRPVIKDIIYRAQCI
jgi:predicted nucleic acid-binding Zn ribbon protein